MLTPPQQQALRLDTHLCVTANAGSGKTLVLVERYLGIVTGGDVSVGEIVAITFTEKAASELKRKIAEGVALRLQGHLPASERAALERAREQLPSAVIDTIHGFCSRILREFPVEAGVDASFTVLEAIDQEALLQESLREVSRAVLRDGIDPHVQAGLLDAARSLGKGTCLHILETLGRKRELVERLTGPEGVYSRTDEDLIHFWRQALAGRLRDALQEKDLLAGLEEILAAARGRAAAETRELMRSMREAPALEGQATALASILRTVLTRDGTLSKTFLGRGVEAGDPRRLAGHARRLAPLLAGITDPGAADRNRELLRTTRTLLAVSRLAGDRYAEKKSSSARLDFDDLQILTRELLKKEFVRARLSARYRYIMVDEYQDTNRLQYEILLPLVGDLRSGNLFIVGDPKQSIYGFRNADVAVFERTRGDIRRREGDRSDVVLGESFRLLGDLAAFTNLLFRPLMGKGGNGGGTVAIPYAELIMARKNPDPGRVEIILLPEDGGTLTAGEAMARRIRALHAGGYPVFDREEQPRAMRYGDVAILLRSRTHLGEIEQALIRNRIPHVVSAGVGYFQTQTVYDFYNYFRFLLNTHDDVALAGILRSPFFSVSDAELFAAAGNPRDGSLWAHLRDGRAREEFPPLARALDMLEADHAEASRLTVPELLDRIVDRTAIEAVWAAVPGGDQAIANLRKLEGIARSHERRGFVTLHDFTGRLKRLVEEEQKEGQAAVDLRRDAVQVLTVHAAKGLEFPIVIVPGLERTLRADRQPFMHEELGIGFAAADDETPPPVMELLKQESRARSVAEEERIFYVACTRARDCLVLCGRAGGEDTGERWMSWLTAALRLDPEGPGMLEIPTFLKTRTTESGELQGHEHMLQVHLVREKDLVDGGADAEATPPPGITPRIAVEPIVRPPRGEIFSATRIRTYLDCPARYYLQYVLGWPGPAEGGSEEPDGNADLPLPADTRGTIIHRSLERCAGADPTLADAILQESAAGEQNVAPGAVEDLARTVRSVLSSTFWRTMEEGTGTRTEFSLTAALDEDFITGTIDRIFRDADGAWHIVDFKTDAVSETTVEKKVAAYLPQIRLYALLAARFHNADRVRATLLFTEIPGSPRTLTFPGTELEEFGRELAGIVKRIKLKDFNPLQSPCPACPLTPDGCSPLFQTPARTPKR